LWANPGGETQTGTILSDPLVTPDPMTNPASLAISVFLKLGFVLALIFLGFYLLRRWQFEKPGARKKQLTILETLYLNPRRTVYMIQAGERRLVLGATDQSITMLTELFPDEETGGPVVSISPDVEFSDILDGSIQK
jgi:flagellar biosynthetic protein FliO